jgi:hypothetical protein
MSTHSEDAAHVRSPVQPVGAVVRQSAHATAASGVLPMSSPPHAPVHSPEHLEAEQAKSSAPSLPAAVVAFSIAHCARHATSALQLSTQDSY